MMGTKERAFAPLVGMSLDDLVPPGHFYRHVERTLDLSFVRNLVAPYYASGGRPSVDPIVFFKLQLVMFFEGIRSERLLMRLVADRLGARWYVGYDLGEDLPDHSSLTKIRERYGVAVFRRFFEAIVEQCQQAGLVWGKELHGDATRVQANASYASFRPRFYVEAHLADLFDAADGGPTAESTAHANGAAAGGRAGAQDAGVGEVRPVAVISPAHDTGDPAAEDERRRDWVAACGRPERALPVPSRRTAADYNVSTTDPDATLAPTKDGGGRVHLGYKAHYLVDGGKARIILNALVTPAEVGDSEPFRDLLWYAVFRWRLRPRQATGDKAYGTADIIAALEERDIRAYMPLAAPAVGAGRFDQDAFLYNAARDVVVCPESHDLRRRQASYTHRIVTYQANAATCAACPCKEGCTTSAQGRTIRRNFDEGYIDRVRTYHDTEPYRKAMRKRSVWVEPLFAEAKDWHGLRRFRLRRLERVNSEALLTAAGQNLKRLLSWRGWGHRPWPGGALGLAVDGRAHFLGL